MTQTNDTNRRYLETKRDRMGHDLPDLDPPAGSHHDAPRRRCSTHSRRC